MKTLTLTNPSFIYLEKSFGEWLSIIGYSESTVKGWPIHVREFLYYLEQHQVNSIVKVSPQRVYHFINYIKSRKSTQTGTGLSTHSVNKIINSVNAFAKYINTTDKHTLDITPKRIALNTLERSILSKEDIKQVYEATFTPQQRNSTAIGQRDRAIIAVFYGCGLRKDEGTRLNIMDIDTYKGLLFVRKGKGNKQRYVPIAARHLEDIRDYLENGRNWFLMDNKNSWSVRKRIKKQHTDDEAFFLNQNGKRLKCFYQRLNYLKDTSGIDTSFSPHTLRHSIATHLLQSGMQIEDIAKFLGHGSLESTQIYTHIANRIQHTTDKGK